MKISAAPSHRVGDLLRFLRQVGYAAEEVEYAVLEVEGGGLEGATETSARVLADRIGIWNSVNDGDACILDALRSSNRMLRSAESKDGDQRANRDARTDQGTASRSASSLPSVIPAPLAVDALEASLGEGAARFVGSRRRSARSRSWPARDTRA